MAGVVAWDHGAFAGAVDEEPAVVGLEVVVVRAERIELVDACASGFGPAFAVVVLESLGASAPFSRAFG